MSKYEVMVRLLRLSISTDYVGVIAEKIGSEVLEDVELCADSDEWNEDDIRLAIGRVLCEKLGIE